MVEQFGMSEKVGPIAISDDGARFLEVKMPWERERNASEELSRIADEEVSRFVREALERALQILSAHEKSLRGGAEALKEKEVLDGDELRKLVDEIEASSVPES
jgi:cell division protease FtsH